MNAKKYCWFDYEPINKQEYDQLRELLFKLQKRIRTSEDRIEGKDELNSILNDLHTRLYRNKCRIQW